jgi:very-short-patch-repair endonuclease
MRITGRDKARADGIEFEIIKDPVHGSFDLYHIPCPRCGTITKKRRYIRENSRLCDYCKKEVKRHEYEYQKSIAEDVETKEDRRFRKAVEEIKETVKDFDSYSESIELARKRSGKYGSIPEVMVAIELLKEGYRIIPQQKIGRYQVDFCLPDEKFVIEVDGAKFHRGISQEREATIQFSLGLEWRIIHIPAEKIRKKIWLVKKIIKEFKTLDC